MRAGVAEGIELGSFAYAAGVSEGGGELKVPSPEQIRLRASIGPHTALQARLRGIA